MSPSVPNSTNSTFNRSLQKQTSYDASHLTAVAPTAIKTPQVIANPYSHGDRVTLDSIVTEYLTNQHALCKNPMVTCPQFNSEFCRVRKNVLSIEFCFPDRTNVRIRNLEIQHPVISRLAWFVGKEVSELATEWIIN